MRGGTLMCLEPKTMLDRKLILVNLYVKALRLIISLLVRRERRINSQVIYFDLRQINYFNYYIALIRAMDAAGYRVVMRPNLKLLANSGHFGDYLRHIENFSFGYISRKKPLLTVIDYERVNGHDCVTLSPDFFMNGSQINTSSILPFPMSPNTLTSKNGGDIAALRLNNKSREIFFSGNIERISYENPLLEQYFGVRNRYTIVKEFSKMQAMMRENGKGERIQLNICSWEGVNRQAHKSRIKSAEWLTVLSKKMFSLCPPGVKMPFCYNLIESLAVGTIPILEYGHLMPVSLKHKVNCIDLKQYSTIEELLHDLGSLDEVQVQQIKCNALSYYDEYLSLDATADLIKKTVGGTLYFMNTPDAEKTIKENNL